VRFTVSQALTLDQLAYVADLEHRGDARARAGQLSQEQLVDDLADKHRQLDRMRRERNRARRVAARLRQENTRLRGLIPATTAPQETTTA